MALTGRTFAKRCPLLVEEVKRAHFREPLSIGVARREFEVDVLELVIRFVIEVYIEIVSRRGVADFKSEIEGIPIQPAIAGDVLCGLIKVVAATGSKDKRQRQEQEFFQNIADDGGCQVDDVYQMVSPCIKYRCT